MLLSKRILKILTWLLAPLLLIALHNKAEGETREPRGEIRLVENHRLDINVLGHNVLQYLFEYAIDKNELELCLGITQAWIDDKTLEIKLREGVRFHNEEPFDADAVKFNFDYQRKHKPGRGMHVCLKNVREIRGIDPYTFHIITNQPDVMLMHRWVVGPIAGWVIGAARYMEEVQKARASFEPILDAGNSPFDRYLYGGDKRVMSPETIRGLECFLCSY
jgi:peptide/nickel transport system substrate-binding protein